jgi:non-heme chloroperoxidase
MRHRRIMAVILVAVVVPIVIAVGVLAAMIAFGTSAPPPPMASISTPFRTVDYSDLPPPATIRARDGTPLSMRVYQAAPAADATHVVIAIHGSSAMGASMHTLAKALRDAGVTVYAPDIRGHGDSGHRGDIDYATQLDDDLSDVVAAVHTAHPKAAITLLGFSSGGGFALHAAATPLGSQFDRAVLISPMLGPRAPTARGVSNAWAQPFLPRIIGLLILNHIGIHAFDGLPALAFGIAPENASRLTGIYSFRLLGAFGTNDYAADLHNAKCPIAVLIGASDEIFFAEKFAPTVHAERADVSVAVVPDVGHIRVILDPHSIAAIVAAVRGA